MSDNLDAFLEDILSLPRWVNRALTLLRELDVKSQDCGEEAQRRRKRYLDLARTKLRSSSTQQAPAGFYNDPELEAEAAAATDRGREAHALMKEKVIVLNQLLRVLRGETEGFKLSLAKFAKEVGGEDVLRQCRRKPDGGPIPCADQTDDAAGGLGAPAVSGPPQLSRTGALRGRIGLPLGATDGSALTDQSVGFLGASDGPAGISCSFPLGMPTTGSGTSRNRPSKRSAVRSSSSAVTSVADGSRSAKRLRPPAVGMPTKKHQGKEGTLSTGIGEDSMPQVHSTGDGSLGGPPMLHMGPPCSASSLASHGAPGARVKRSKHPADTLQGPQSGGALLAPVHSPDIYGDQTVAGRPTRGNAGRFKKGRERLPDVPVGTPIDAPEPTADAAQCENRLADERSLEGANMQPAGLLIRLPSSVPLQQQPSVSKAKSPAERANNKPAARLLTARTVNPRTGPG